MKCAICKRKKEVGRGTFFAVPNDDRRLKWTEACGINFGRTAQICIDHFAPSSLVKSGQYVRLLSNAVPTMPNKIALALLQTTEEEQHQDDALNARSSPDVMSDVSINSEFNEEYLIEQNTCHSPPPLAETKEQNQKFSLEHPANIIFENTNQLFASNLFNLSNNVMPPQLQEEPIMEMLDINSISCTASTQTNTLICGLVKTSPYSDEFRFDCFYCSAVFPLEKWKIFLDHLKDKHSRIEEAFKMHKYVSDDHDYTPINLMPSTQRESVLDDIATKAEKQLLGDPLETIYNSMESVVINPNIDYESDEINSASKNSNITNNFIEAGTSESTKFRCLNRGKCNKNQTLKKTALSRCLKRSNRIEIMEAKENKDSETVSIEIDHLTPTEIVFEYTPREIVDLLLDSMQNYPVLWQFDNEPFNEDFYEAVEDLCRIVNDRWSLNIDNLTMRRSINRILRFYCNLFPNTNIENIDEYTNYYDKCATFLPPSVKEVAYARCSHCYKCYRNDFDLKHHLLEEQKYLQWPYKCVQCKECFRERDEYEFHKRLLHYDEVFRCEPCNKRFVRRNKYNKHEMEYHLKEKHCEYKCDLCERVCQTKASFRHHKITHRERKYKCHLCPKSYCVNSKLMLHLKSHRKEYDFICEICGKEFLVEANLRQHMKKHTGAKVTCNICNLKLRNSSLRRHIRIMHEACSGPIEKLKKGISYSRLIQSKPVQRRTHRERIYHCKICKIRFENYKAIAEHNKKIHSDNPRFPCKICRTEFSLTLNLRQHYRKKHNLHVIQVYKLVNESEDLNKVLNMDKEFLEELTKKMVASTNKLDSIVETHIKSPSNLDYEREEVFFQENKQSSTIQDEIVLDANVIFTDLFKEQ